MNTFSSSLGYIKAASDLSKKSSGDFLIPISDVLLPSVYNFVLEPEQIVSEGKIMFDIAIPSQPFFLLGGVLAYSSSATVDLELQGGFQILTKNAPRNNVYASVTLGPGALSPGQFINFSGASSDIVQGNIIASSQYYFAATDLYGIAPDGNIQLTLYVAPIKLIL